MPRLPVRSRLRLSTATNPEEAVAAVDILHHNLRLHIRYVSPKDLKPPKRKLRKHNKRQLTLIAASVRGHGFLDPLLVDSQMQIVCGYGRWLAASELKLDLVPVIEVEHLSPEQLRIYALAENRLGDLSEFDIGELKQEFIELSEIDCELNLELSGFATSEFDDLVWGKDPDFDGGDAPRLKSEAVTVPGDLYRLGNHFLYCGDSNLSQSLVTVMQGEKAAMVFSDAPYNLSSSSISGMGKHKHEDFEQAAGEMSIAQFTEFLAASFRRVVEHSTDGSLHFQCMDWRHMREMLAAGYLEYTELKNLIIYAKPSAGMGTCYRSQHELIFLWKNGRAPHTNNFGLGETGRHRSNVWSSYKGNAGFHRDRDDELAAHPTVKPVSLVADAIRDCSKRNAIILDPFGGFGTTIIAAERTGRRARVIEIDPKYCDASILRWEKASGKQAVLVATGQTFVEVAAARGIVLPGGESDEEAGLEEGPDVEEVDADEVDDLAAEDGEDA